MRRPRCGSDRVLRRSLVAVATVLTLTGCTGGTGEDSGLVTPDTQASAGATERSGGALILVLPAADALSEPSRDELRALVEAVEVERTADAWEALEPATAASLADAIEIAVRRSGGDGTVCMIGTRGRSALSAVLARYPAARACVVPGPVPSGVAEARVAAGDVDLTRLGRELGVVARGAAGDGSVLVLDGGDGLLDVRWRRGIEEGVLGVAGGSGPALGIVTSAAQALTLLDAQAALLAEGIVPGGPEATAPGDDGAGARASRDGLPPADLLPTARSLLPVAVVILDAGPEAVPLAMALAERGIRVVAPTALLRAGAVDADQVVLHWRVRWEVPLAEVLAARAGDDPVTPVLDPFVLVPGQAAPVP